jgi:pimeloyl-ACP methyl ester carboxylesterase
MAVLLLISNLTRLLNHTVFKIEGSGKPLLILHGFLVCQTIGKQSESQNGFEVHPMDLNHGRSMQSLEFSYELMAQDLNEYCVGHNLTSIDLLGHSMGGKTAMLLLNILI